MPKIRKRTTEREYILELNRANGDSVRKAQIYFERRGIATDVLPHKTTLLLKKPNEMDFTEFKLIVGGSVQRRIGSALMFSKFSGKAFIYSNKGNQPRRFISV
ncbi:hypothetical protein Rleg5DRAFT_6244 [Rhizobium leguminosarum bv. viciae WSM1455]|nr:hypothetical protein Rleg5DRAFT_6244 [Rhizobium leguminosarum bv. viciae WSM1455]